MQLTYGYESTSEVAHGSADGTRDLGSPGVKVDRGEDGIWDKHQPVAIAREPSQQRTIPN